MRTLDVKPYDPLTDVIVIEGTKYSGDLFRELGINGMQTGTLFRIDRRDEDGVFFLTVLGK